jgi:RNA-directed DNA polymerase
MSLTTPISVQKLQTALRTKAKESPDFRFHVLYDKVYRKDVLAYVYERCKANGGAAGVDNQTFEDIEASDREWWLDELNHGMTRVTGKARPPY